MERSDLGITLALSALFLAGLLAWSTVLRRERTDLLSQAQLRLDSVAAQVRDDARCVELFAERSLPGGSAFYLITPPSSGPMMKPSPNAAPINPKFFARLSGVLISAM